VVGFLVWPFLATLRPRALLVAEYLRLGQQLPLPQLRHPQPRLRNADRQFRICATLITELVFCALHLDLVDYWFYRPTRC
jgi:hypothetical protein